MNYRTNDDIVERILDEEVEFFTDELNGSEVYVEHYDADDVLVFESVSSPYFNSFLCSRYMELEECKRNPQYKPILDAYISQAIYHHYDNAVTIHRRLSGRISKGPIAYCLADRKNSVYVIEPGAISKKRPDNLKFLSAPETKAQSVPKKGGNLFKLLRPFVNLPDDEFILLTVALVQSFSRESSHFALILSSSKGTGKSTLTQVIRELVDPSDLALTLTSTSESDLKNTLANAYMVCFDNTDALSKNYSNILCAAITGAKHVKRKLYTDADQVILSLHNLVILNGIGIVPYQSDLAERSLYFSLLPIEPENRRPDSELWDDFNAVKPQIVGAIFTTLARAMKLFPTIKTKKLHRMADAHKEMLAVALALGIPENDFNGILNRDKDALEQAYCESNEFVEIVREFFDSHGQITDQAAKVYEAVRNSASSLKGFPGSASSFTRKLELERDALKGVGIAFAKFRDTADENRCKVSIYKYGETPTMTTKPAKRTPSARKVSSLLADDDE